jgi:dTDP-4-dehydrorhamnose reductase
MPLPTAWITGANGLIGNYIVKTAAQFAPGWKVLPITRDVLDLSDFSALDRKFSADKPQLIIHCAALSKSPVCQQNPALAWRENFEVTKRLSEIASDIPFLFFSSDLVFDGKKGNYVESDSPNPLSVYAETKVAAENVVLKNPKHTVVRTSLNAGISLSKDRAFTEEMRRAWQIGQTLKLFTDEFRCPIPAEITARAIWELVGKNQPGLYHLAGSERLSRFEIGQLLAKRWPDLHPKIQASSLREYTGAPRPPDTSLNCSKIQKLLSFPLPRFAEWLRDRESEV